MLLDIMMPLFCWVPRFCWSKACNSSSSLNYSLRSSKCLMRIKLWQFNKTMHQWSFLPPDYITQLAEYVSLRFFYLYPSIFLWIHGYVLRATVSSQQEGRKWRIAVTLLALLHNGYRVLWPKVAMNYFSKKHCLKMLQKNVNITSQLTFSCRTEHGPCLSERLWN